MSKTSRPYREGIIARLKDNHDLQVEHIKAALEEKDMPDVFLLALRDVAEAHGFSKFAEEAELSRESLYRTLSRDGNPKLESIFKMLDAVGLRLTVESKQRVS
jgi:probable addiction module antidote protein